MKTLLMLSVFGLFTVGGAALAKSVAKVAPVLASGKIEAKSGSKLTGTVTFVADDKKNVTLKIEVSGVSPGDHAVHLHEKGDCSDPEGKNAGGHWNPAVQPHGKWGPTPHHLGDIGNLVVGADGKGTLTMSTDQWTVKSGEPNDVVGKALIVHASIDDFKTQPTGNAGGRIGCAVITAP